MSTLGIMGKSSEALLLMLHELEVDKTAQKQIIRKTMNMAIRCSYYVFCGRNKAWNNPDLLDSCYNFLFCIVVADYIVLLNNCVVL